MRDNTEEYRLLVDGIMDHAIFMIDAEGIVTTWNLGAQRIMGYCKGEIVGRDYSCFFTPEDVMAGLPARALVLARRSGSKTSEGFRVRKNGERFWARSVLIALVDSRDGLLGFGQIVEDLTERRGLEQELRERNAEMERALGSTFSARAVGAGSGAHPPPGEREWRS